MSNKPNTLGAFVVTEPAEGSDKKPYFHRVGTLFPHKNGGGGFDLVIPKGISLSGRVVCLPPKADEPAVAVE